MFFCLSPCHWFHTSCSSIHNFFQEFRVIRLVSSCVLCVWVFFFSFHSIENKITVIWGYKNNFKFCILLVESQRTTKCKLHFELLPINKRSYGKYVKTTSIQRQKWLNDFKEQSTPEQSFQFVKKITRNNQRSTINI